MDAPNEADRTKILYFSCDADILISAYKARDFDLEHSQVLNLMPFFSSSLLCCTFSNSSIVYSYLYLVFPANYSYLYLVFPANYVFTTINENHM